jgi:ABC-type spermidine/putrescine transport system permease subunit I
MLKRLRENKSAQGTLLALPTTIWLFVLLILPLILTLIVSFGRRSPDGNVIYTFTLDNYARLFGYSTDCPAGQSSCFDPIYLNILERLIQRCL